MSPDTLREGAILIADAHCAPWRPVFGDFLCALEEGRIQTPQLILMGDIFDLLFGPIPATRRLNEANVERLNRLSHRIEIIYLEGNHDFALSQVFPHITVIPRQMQPWIAGFGTRKIALSHGDLGMGPGYEGYTAIIRNAAILSVLNIIDRIGGGFIVNWLIKMMQRKNHCKKIEYFEALIAARLKRQNYDGIDILIEGHFHQNRTLNYQNLQYVNVGAFACNERYFSVQSIENQPLLREAVFRKEPV